MLDNAHIAFVGGGAMAEAIIKGLLAQDAVMPDQMVASDPLPIRREELASAYGVRTSTDNVEAVRDADIIVLCVKPQVAEAAMAKLARRIPSRSLVLSIMAGVPISTMRTALQHNMIVRSIPNTPAQVGKGATVWTATPQVSDEQRTQVAEILSALGEHIAVADEHYLDAATGLSGSGPGFVFLLIEALVDAGVQIGFSRPDAEKLVLQTVEGSIALMRETGQHPAVLRNRVTSPAGTTAAGLYEMEAGNIRAILIRAVEAAYARSVALGSDK